MEPPREADRFAHGRTTVPGWNRLFKPVAQYSLLFPSTGFDPATPDPEFLWLSRYRCTEPEPEPPTPQAWNSAPGTWPGRARIGGGRYRSRKARKGLEETWPQGRALFCLGAGLRSRPAFNWREWHAGAGPSGGRSWGRSDSGSEMKSLRKLAGKCPPPPALGSATLQVWREVGTWARALSRGRWRAWPSGERGLRGCPADAWGEDQGPGPTEAGHWG